MKRIVMAACLVCVLAGAFVLPRLAQAGANSAELDCRAKEGKQTLAGTIPRDFIELDLKFDSGDGTPTTWSDDENLVMTDRVSDHLLLMKVIGEPSLTFWALPKTMKVESKRGQQDAIFDAKVRIESKGADPIELTLACNYHYAI